MLLWCCAIQCFKGFVEVAQIAESGFQRNVKNAPIRVEKQVLCILQLETIQVLQRSLLLPLLEHAA
ncbi:hypothetical protein D3C79_1084720 [compost metagenome]